MTDREIGLVSSADRRGPRPVAARPSAADYTEPLERFARLLGLRWEVEQTVAAFARELAPVMTPAELRAFCRWALDSRRLREWPALPALLDAIDEWRVAQAAPATYPRLRLRDAEATAALEQIRQRAGIVSIDEGRRNLAAGVDRMRRLLGAGEGPGPSAAGGGR